MEAAMVRHEINFHFFHLKTCRMRGHLPAVVKGHIKVNNVAVLERSCVRNTVANDLVYGSKQQEISE